MRAPVIAFAAIMLSACFAQGEKPPAAEQEPPRFELASADPIEHGKRLSAVLGCTGCHGETLTGEDWTDPDMGVLWTANLTRSAAEYTHDELLTMITQGRRPDRALMDMPAFLFSDVHPEDLRALILYLQSLEPDGEAHSEPTIGPALAADMESGEWKDSVALVAENRDKAPLDLGSDHSLGRHILRATCAECHGMDLRGSEAPFVDAPARPDLRIVASYSREDFARLMKTGVAAGDRDLELMSAVARRRYSQFTEIEVSAIYDYLSELARSDP